MEISLYPVSNARGIKPPHRAAGECHPGKATLCAHEFQRGRWRVVGRLRQTRSPPRPPDAPPERPSPNSIDKSGLLGRCFLPHYRPQWRQMRLIGRNQSRRQEAHRGHRGHRGRHGCRGAPFRWHPRGRSQRQRAVSRDPAKVDGQKRLSRTSTFSEGVSALPAPSVPLAAPFSQPHASPLPIPFSLSR